MINTRALLQPNETLNTPDTLAVSTVSATLRHSQKNSSKNNFGGANIQLSDLIRGSASLGAFLEMSRYEAMPSPLHPSPASVDETYYWGAYTVAWYRERFLQVSEPLV